MSESNNVIKNFFWRFFERIGARGVSFVVSIFLARILFPSDYAVIALVNVVLNIMQVFVDSGLGVSLIQKKNVDDLDYSSVFIFNMIFCLFLYIVLFFIAPHIANFYNMPILKNVMRVLGLTLIISGIKNIQQSYVAKNMIYKKFFVATMFGTILAAIIGIFMAYNNFGVWALVTQSLVNNIIDTIILFIIVDWRPKLMFSIKRLLSLFSFGVKLLGVSLINTIYNDIRTIVIGKFYTANDLAYYNKGQSIPQQIAYNIDVSMDSVLLPTMSKFQDELFKVKNMTRLSVRVGTYVMIPIMFGIAVCSNNLVLFVLTEKWLPAVFFIEIFCISFSLYSFATSIYNALKALGLSNIYLKISIISKCIGIFSLLIAVRFNVYVIALSSLLTTISTLLICSFFSKKYLLYNFFEQIYDLFPNITIGVIMSVIVYFIGKLNVKIYILLFIQFFVGLLCYIILSHITKNNSYLYIVAKIKNYVKSSHILNKN